MESLRKTSYPSDRECPFLPGSLGSNPEYITELSWGWGTKKKGKSGIPESTSSPEHLGWSSKESKRFLLTFQMSEILGSSKRTQHSIKVPRNNRNIIVFEFPASQISARNSYKEIGPGYPFA